MDKQLIDSFSKEYYHSLAWDNTYWKGVLAKKCPLDLWAYQEIIYETKPDVIIECGTAEGGSALFMADICELLGHGHVITIDIVPTKIKHDRLFVLNGSSTDIKIVEKVKECIGNALWATVMVILDSDHRKEHVLKELSIYAPLVTKDNYLIVEDTNLNGHPVTENFVGEGPMEALQEFGVTEHGFMIDSLREKHFLTMNPKGYLLKVR